MKVSLWILVFCLLATTGRANEIWFAPRGPDVHPGAAVDWNDLFKPTPEWSSVASKINVFVKTAGYFVQTPDEELKAAASDLANRHIALALGMQSVGIGASDKCGHEEGYGLPDYSAKAAEKLHRLGITLDTIALDEPVWFGHYDSGSQGCKFDPKELARRVVENVAAYQQFFPNVTIGDIEPVPLITTFPDWQSTFDIFSREITRLTGKPLKYLQTDVNWRDPDFTNGLRAIATFAHSRDLKLGIIYNGDGADTSGADWVADAIHHFEIVEDINGLLPDQATFETWDQLPTHVFPETADDTLSHILHVYLLPRPSLVAVRKGNIITGSIKDTAGQLINNVTIVMKTSGLIPKQGVPERTISGIVPSEAAYAIIGLRVNTECFCEASNDLVAGNLTFTEAGKLTYSYNLVDQAKTHDGKIWNGIDIAAIQELGHTFAHLVVPPGKHLGFNSDIFNVLPGASFTFSMPLASLNGRGMAGAATIIWLDKDRHGIPGVHRSNLYLGSDESIVVSTKTDQSGQFSMIIPHGEAGPLQTVEFGGNLRFRATGQRLK